MERRRGGARAETEDMSSSRSRHNCGGKALPEEAQHGKGAASGQATSTKDSVRAC